MATIAYIDGFNFYYGAVKDTRFKWLNLEKFCQHLLPRDDIIQIRYFTAQISERPDDPDQVVRQQAYLRAIATLPIVTVHYGHFYTRSVRMRLADPPDSGPRSVEVIKTEEKGSDVNLASYLLLDTFQSRCDTAVVFSNDSDLAEAIRIVQNELDTKVGIVNPHPRNRQSRKLQQIGCQFYKQVPRGALAAAQFPPTLYDDAGEIRKPDRW